MAPQIASQNATVRSRRQLAWRGQTNEWRQANTALDGGSTCQRTSGWRDTGEQAPASIAAVRIFGAAMIQARPATEEEEEWLDSQDIGVYMEPPSSEVFPWGSDNNADLVSEAEEFDLEVELERWQEAEDEALYEEMDRVNSLIDEEELQNLEFLLMADANFSTGQELARTLQEGAQLLMDEQKAEATSFEHLMKVRHAAQCLLGTVDRAVQFAIDRERVQAWEAASAARRELHRVKEEASQRCAALREEMEKIAEQERTTKEQLDVEESRTTCRICFAMPRDVILLPCMHFDYCYSCFLRHKQRSKTCPTCRCPTQGELKCNLSIS